MDFKKKDPTICCQQGILFTLKGTHRLKLKRKKIFYANRKRQQKKIAILISGNISFKSKETEVIYNDKKVNRMGGYNNCKHIYAPNIKTHKYVEQILTILEGEIDSNIIIAL
jgi:hypothetical protein